MPGAQARGINRTTLTAVVLFAVAVAMGGLAFASVPLYRLFCQVTGFAGTPKTGAYVGTASAGAGAAGEVTVRFDANVNSQLPWQFQPAERQVVVRPGQEVLVHFRAHNLADHPITGTATFNVTPFKAAQYFNKIECFCFTEQTLKPGEDVSMPVVFYVDPQLFEDPNTAEVRNITLSYTFFPVEAQAQQPSAGEKAL
ncbi:MAG: cytochrome c oxidase assembly protein [Defluviicoccus sp.]|nr:cytochrome c oxidase assembly protein [Defluviicoccus sp.]MDG4607847.1 cytochrome c oxidase assembly protein [Defluviicoccus sp.]